MKQKTQDILYSYWNEVRAGRLAPQRLDIEPSRIAAILSETFMLERVDARTYRYRLAGTRLCGLFGSELRGQNFLADVIEASRDVPVIVDFWAPWCQPCRQVSPIVEQIASMREGAYKVVKVNIDEEPQLAQTFEVQSIPMIGLFRNGRLERAALGAKPRQQLEAELGMLVIP